MANTYFTDNVIDLGAFPTGSAVTLTALLDVTTMNVSDGYNIAMIVGNDSLVPEPTTAALLVAGLLALGGRRRVRR